MSDLETNHARMLTALSRLETKIQALKSGDAAEATQAAQISRITDLEAQVETLQQASQETLKDLDLALAQLADLGIKTSA